MVTDKLYQLHGYLEYLPMESGFVTPVFERNCDLYVQLSSDNMAIVTFEKIPLEFKSKITNSPTKSIYKKEGDNCVFGFKFQKEIFINETKDLISIFYNKILNGEVDPIARESIASFIIEQKGNKIFEDEDKADALKEELWEKCIQIISVHKSKRWSKIFEAEVRPQTLSSQNLILATSNESLEIIFERNFKKEVLYHLRSFYKVDYSISFYNVKSEESNLIKEITPFKFFGGGSYKKATTINKSYNFDNYIIGSFNNEAYNRCISFSDPNVNNNNDILIIQGQRGIGKTHLTHALGNFLQKNRSCNVYLASALDYIENFYTNSNDLGKKLVDANIIIIDDGHLIERDVTSFWESIRSLSHQNKKIIITYNLDTDKISLPISVIARDGLKIPNFELAYLTVPRIEDKVDILRKKLGNTNVYLPENAINHLANKSPNNIADLERGLTYAYFQTQLELNSQNVEGNYNSILDFYFNNKIRLSEKGVIDIQHSVCKYFNIQDGDLFKPIKKLHIATAIDVTAFLCDLVLPFNNADSLTFYKWKLSNHYSLENMRKRMSFDSFFHKSVIDIYKNILGDSSEDNVIIE